MTNSEIQEIFEDIFFEEDFENTSRLHSPEFGVNEVQNVIVTLYGGLNGWGDFRDYLYDLYELLDALDANNIEGYIVKFNIDALDDVFDVEKELKEIEDENNKIKEGES